jgi:hypothetical protein
MTEPHAIPGGPPAPAQAAGAGRSVAFADHVGAALASSQLARHQP